MGGKGSKASMQKLSSAEQKYAASSATLQHEFDNCSLANFDVLGTLGEGTFGRVRLARHKVVSEFPVAIKILKKKAAVKLKQVAHLKNEKAILSSIRHPGIVRLYSTFQDPAHVFMVLEYVAGGEMFKYLRDEGKFDLNRTRLYAAEIFLALEFLHRSNIIYRDLKPENLLITREGHIVVTDFGFAKVLDPGSRTYTTCGTPDYLAPEIIRSKGHGKPVDWWAFGVLVFEMATGFPPFYDDSVVEVYKKIIRGNCSKFPKDVAKDKTIVSLVKSLLQTDISRRLGCMKKGTKQIFSHSFFKKLKWNDVYTRGSAGPFKPPMSADPFDMSNFDEYEDEVIEGVQSDLTEREQKMFSNF